MNPFPKNVPENAQGSEEEQLMELLKSNPELMQKYQEEIAKFQLQANKMAKHPPMTNQQYIDKLDNI